MSELDEAEKRAIEMIRFFQEECRKQCEPYVKTLMDIQALRPQVFYIDGKMMVPFMPAAQDVTQR
jgi:hypothetical protein